VQFSVRVD